MKILAIVAYIFCLLGCSSSDSIQLTSYRDIRTQFEEYKFRKIKTGKHTTLYLGDLLKNNNIFISIWTVKESVRGIVVFLHSKDGESLNHFVERTRKILSRIRKSNYFDRNLEGKIIELLNKKPNAISLKKCFKHTTKYVSTFVEREDIVHERKSLGIQVSDFKNPFGRWGISFCE